MVHHDSKVAAHHGSKTASPAKAQPQQKMPERPKLSEPSRPSSVPKLSKTQQVPNLFDLDNQSASQLSADALEYSVQTLESMGKDGVAEQPQAALREVEVIQPKTPIQEESAMHG